MDASDSEDRKQYAEQLERAAEEQRQAYRVFSDRSKTAEERRTALRSAALRDQDEVTEAIDVIRDREEDAKLRASALHAIDIAVGKRHDLIDLVIGLLRDSAEPAVLRLEGVMNSTEKPHWNADSSVSLVFWQSRVFPISKPFLSKFITRSSRAASPATEQL